MLTHLQANSSTYHISQSVCKPHSDSLAAVCEQESIRVPHSSFGSTQKLLRNDRSPDTMHIERHGTAKLHTDKENSISSTVHHALTKAIQRTDSKHARAHRYGIWQTQFNHTRSITMPRPRSAVRSGLQTSLHQITILCFSGCGLNNTQSHK